MRRNKRWFGPSPIGWNPIWPRSWEGIAVTIALLTGLVLLKLEPDHIRAAIAFALMVVAYGAVVYLTWSRDEA